MDVLFCVPQLQPITLEMTSPTDYSIFWLVRQSIHTALWMQWLRGPICVHLGPGVCEYEFNGCIT